MAQFAGDDVSSLSEAEGGESQLLQVYLCPEIAATFQTYSCLSFLM